MLHRVFLLSLSLIFLVGCEGEKAPPPDTAPTAPASAEVSSESAPAEEQGTDGEATVSAPTESVNSAAYNGNVEVLKQHVAAGSDLNEKEPTSGATPLISAVTFDRREAARVLIDGGADLNIQNKEGSTALHIAAFLCRTEIVEMLLEAGASKDVMNKVGSTALNGVEGPFDQVRPIYDLLGAVLAPLGLKLDYERLKTTRPKIAEMLR